MLVAPHDSITSELLLLVLLVLLVPSHRRARKRHRKPWHGHNRIASLPQSKRCVRSSQGKSQALKIRSVVGCLCPVHRIISRYPYLGPWRIPSISLHSQKHRG
ncbi:hypothetical protein ONS95_002486 [Cadophora gregata]|uniref:uncharacterized protein n=1 Tax=Cadophora gregata TaxID=51156 RepID=UPI0026DC2248|nr:uncharacterized protein ONS95_002486 [Cadophora gregata]KAK0109814.1 hypothetical protein ONS95_002486 [Cadophora gregata]